MSPAFKERVPVLMTAGGLVAAALLGYFLMPGARRELTMDDRSRPASVVAGRAAGAGGSSPALRNAVVSSWQRTTAVLFVLPFSEAVSRSMKRAGIG